jgi:hypothetical protein
MLTAICAVSFVRCECFIETRNVTFSLRDSPSYEQKDCREPAADGAEWHTMPS